MNAWAFGGKRLYDLVRLADTTEINSFVIDVKDDTGYLTYRSSVPTAIAIGANDQRRARDAEERLRMLQARDSHLSRASSWPRIRCWPRGSRSGRSST